MAYNQDARPFVDLKKDAEEFRMKFDEDIKECLRFLDTKITALICDPDSFGTSGRSIHQNALAEFSKAKYSIFIGAKALINAKEREWLTYITEMKKLFIENVEIFLAGTKLEVKLPPSESTSSQGPRKSPGNLKSNTASVTSAIYPILSTITKNIPGLGSSFLERDAHSAVSKAYAGEKTQFNRRGRLSASSIKLANSSYEEEEMDSEELELDRSQSRSSSGTRSQKLSNSGLNTSRSSSGRRSSLKRENDLGLNTSQSSSGRRSSLKREMDLGLNDMDVSVSIKQAKVDVSESVNANNLPSKVLGRRGKLAKKNSFIDNKPDETAISVVQSHHTDTNVTAPVRGRRGRLTEVSSSIENDSVGLDLKKGGRKQQAVKSKKVAQNSSNSSDANEDQTIETTEKEIPLKERRGRSAPKAKTNAFSVVAPDSSCSTNESEDQAIETIKNEVPVKGRKGKSAPKAKTNVVVQNSNSSTDENETIKNEVPLKGRKGRSASKAKTNIIAVVAESNSNNTGENEGQSIENEVPLKGRKGRSAPKAKANVVIQSNNNSTDENEGQSIENEVPLKGRKGRSNANVIEKVNSETSRGRSTVSKNVSKVSDQNVTQRTTIRGRKAVKPMIEEEMYEPDQNVTQRTTIRGRKAVKPMIEEEMYEPGPSKSPKKVSFGGDQSSSDELDIQTPLARPVKSAARRKTLLPKLDDLSGADIIPGSSSRTKAKRKTISDVTELETVASSKRLKVSQKTISSQEEESSADDNLLESDGNYSEWMSLKSVDGKIPTRPAIYEVKVWRAKKPAYIGSCENLRQKLTLYNLRQNSGHKHLDKFIDRNFNEIQVRFEVVSSFNDAKQEVKNRIDSFKAQHKNPPAYN